MRFLDNVQGMMPKVLDQELPKCYRSINAYHQMNCWHCKTELIWGGDHSLDGEDYPT